MAGVELNEFKIPPTQFILGFSETGKAKPSPKAAKRNEQDRPGGATRLRHNSRSLGNIGVMRLVRDPDSKSIHSESLAQAGP